MNPDNAEQRTRMVAAKLRNAARQHDARWVVLDIARLTTDLGEGDRQFLVVVSHYLARLVGRAYTLGVPSLRQLDWVNEIPGEAGERLTCRVLAIAEDIALQDKIDHLTRRLASHTATGDDQELVDAVLAAAPNPTQLAPWTDALGTPSPPPADPEVQPRDWARAWRWSAVLPPYLLTPWQEQIAAVSVRHGRLDPGAFDRRFPTSYAMWGQSAYSTDELAALSVLDAASMIAGWRPDADSDQRMLGARELARTLQTVVTAGPQAWAVDPPTVVETLREPVYVLHYLRALTDKAADILGHTGGIVAAAQLASSERWTPTVLGNDELDYEPDWQGVDTAIVDLVTALADHGAPFAEELDTVWAWALAALDSPPETDNTTMDDALHRAINSPRGRGLQAVLSLAEWEHRNLAAIRPQFIDTLDHIVHLTGPFSIEYRAILASQRLRLERIAQDWLDRRVDTLFRDDDLGSATVDLTLKYARYTTPWLHRTLREDIIAAALRGAENAVASLLLGTLEGEPGYEIDVIITALRKDAALLARAVEEMAHLVQNSPAEAPELATAVQFWQALLDANRDVVPADGLRGIGRWAFVTSLPDSTWAPLTVQTLILTGGLTHYAIEVADRCETVPIPNDSTKILLLLQGHGEPWEQHHIAQVALKALRTLSTDRSDENFVALRTRLLELGHDQVADLTSHEAQS